MLQNIDDVVRSGANVIVVGSAVFNHRGSVADNIAALRAACGECPLAGCLEDVASSLARLT